MPTVHFTRVFKRNRCHDRALNLRQDQTCRAYARWPKHSFWSRARWFYRQQLPEPQTLFRNKNFHVSLQQNRIVPSIITSVIFRNRSTKENISDITNRQLWAVVSDSPYCSLQSFLHQQKKKNKKTGLHTRWSCSRTHITLKKKHKPNFFF